MTDVPILERLAAHWLNGSAEGVGLPSYCTAHPDVLLAILRCYRGSTHSILIEATCNQVNQFGGYTGMTPFGFVEFIKVLAGHAGIEESRLLLGGDHLGPNPWRHLSAAEAMANAEVLVRDYVAAGFTKIHLDASMLCADDVTLSEAEIATRAALLCLSAERAAKGRRLHYIIGSEVPTPGGESRTAGEIKVTDAASVHATIGAHKAAFEALDLKAAFDRIVGLVTQPGVDFGNSHVRHFEPQEAGELSGALSGQKAMVYEAHSTDYQKLPALTALVNQRFSILKVGPELTYAYREAVQVMTELEEKSGATERSGIIAELSDALDRNPDVWRDYVGPDEDLYAARLGGLSDRVRYVWRDPVVLDALGILRQNLETIPADAPLLPDCLREVRAAFTGVDLTLYDAVVQAKVGDVVQRYRAACGESPLEERTVEASSILDEMGRLSRKRE